MPDPGSVDPVEIVAASSNPAARRSSDPGGAAPAGARARSPPARTPCSSPAASPRAAIPIAVFGPQTGYFAPQLLMEQDAHAPGGPAGPGDRRPRRRLRRHQPLRAARPRAGLLVVGDLVGPGHHRHLRGEALRAGREQALATLDVLRLQRPVHPDGRARAHEHVDAERRRHDAARLARRCASSGPRSGSSTRPRRSRASPTRSRSCARPTSTRSTRRSRSPTGTAPRSSATRRRGRRRASPTT